MKRSEVRLEHRRMILRIKMRIKNKKKAVRNLNEDKKE